MGFISSFMNSLGKNVGEQMWPFYEQACRADQMTLRSYVENETNNLRRSIYLLALCKKDSYKAKEYYKRFQNAFNNSFNTLRNYYKFQPEIDRFIKQMGSGY